MYPNSLFAQPLTKSSLVYLLFWHPPLHTPYIYSTNHCILFPAAGHWYQIILLGDLPKVVAWDLTKQLLSDKSNAITITLSGHICLGQTKTVCNITPHLQWDHNTKYSVRESYAMSGVELKSHLKVVQCFLLITTFQHYDAQLITHKQHASHFLAGTMLRIYQVLTLSVPLYESERWTLLATDTRSLESIQMKCQMHILGVTWHDHLRITEITEHTGYSTYGPKCQKHNSLFGHVARPGDDTAHQALERQINISLRRLPDSTWKRLQDLRRCAIHRRHSGVPDDNAMMMTMELVNLSSHIIMYIHARPAKHQPKLSNATWCTIHDFISNNILSHGTLWCVSP